MADVVGASFDEQTKQLTVVAYPSISKPKKAGCCGANAVDDGNGSAATAKQSLARQRREYNFSLLRMCSRGQNAEPHELEKAGRQWMECINCTLDGQPAHNTESEEHTWKLQRPHLLVLINPYGGSGKASDMYAISLQIHITVA
jgi:hypothetical protein